MLSVGCHGKLPSHGDFVRVVGSQSPVEVIDAWLASGPIDPRVDAARAEAFAAAAPAFSIIATKGHWWGCASFPSQDSVGRRYPFTVFAGLPQAEVGEAGYLLAGAFLPFFMRCFQAAQQGWPADLGTLRSGLPNLAPAIDLGAEERRLIAAFDTTSIGEVWAGLLGSATDARTEGILADVLALAAGVVPSGGYRFQPMAHQNHLGFWLMLLMVCGERPVLPSVITLRFAAAGKAPAATLFFERPEAAACLASLWPEVAPRGASPVHDATAQAGSLGDEDIPPALLAPDLTLRDLVHSLTRAVRQRRTMRITRRPTAT